MKRIAFEALTVHAIYNEFSTFNIYHEGFTKFVYLISTGTVLE